jgi:hypothetical protein
LSRITPSAVVTAIETTFPWTLAHLHHSLNQSQCAPLGMILEMSDAIPDELLPSDREAAVALFAAKSAIRTALAQWSGMSTSSPSALLLPLNAFDGRAPVEVIRDVLLDCPDEAAALSTESLLFVRDAKLRESLRIDWSSSRSNFDRGEWKAATVLAGSVTETLLLDAIESIGEESLRQAFRQWRQRSRRPGESSPNNLSPDKSSWSLYTLIWMARCLEIISEETAALADVSRDYRNLIHAGVTRLTMPADQGTAHAALGAASRVAAELEQRSESSTKP